MLTAEWCELVREKTADLPPRPGATADLEFAVHYPPGVTTSVTFGLTDGQIREVALRPSRPPHMRIECELEDFADYLREGSDAVHRAYLTGRMRTTGDLDAVIALAPVLDSDEYAAALRGVHAATSFR